jgi:WbqC-like protein family
VTTRVVRQPGYLPGLGYFDLLQKADIFVHYDDVQVGYRFGFAGSKCRSLDIEYLSSELHPFSVKRLTGIPLRLRQVADV